jgi:hypothetical protein
MASPEALRRCGTSPKGPPRGPPCEQHPTQLQAPGLQAPPACAPWPLGDQTEPCQLRTTPAPAPAARHGVRHLSQRLPAPSTPAQARPPRPSRPARAQPSATARTEDPRPEPGQPAGGRRPPRSRPPQQLCAASGVPGASAALASVSALSSDEWRALPRAGAPASRLPGRPCAESGVPQRPEQGKGCCALIPAASILPSHATTPPWNAIQLTARPARPPPGCPAAPAPVVAYERAH